jgi:hypothetical protein
MELGFAKLVASDEDRLFEQNVHITRRSHRILPDEPCRQSDGDKQASRRIAERFLSEAAG